MSKLRSMIESLRAESLAELPDARVEEDFSELHEAVEALEAERLSVWPRSTGGACSSATVTCLLPRGS